MKKILITLTTVCVLHWQTFGDTYNVYYCNFHNTSVASDASHWEDTSGCTSEGCWTWEVVPEYRYCNLEEEEIFYTCVYCVKYIIPNAATLVQHQGVCVWDSNYNYYYCEGYSQPYSQVPTDEVAASVGYDCEICNPNAG